MTSIEKDIDFTISHFEKTSLLPRKMRTKQHNYQFTINSKDEIIEKCLTSDLVDCRINAYPESVSDYKFTIQAPNFIFIDLDLSNFTKYKQPKRMLDETLKNTLYKISESFSLKPSQHTQHSHSEKEYDIQQQHLEFTNEVKPTVLWSGNGYHIYQPLEAFLLEQEELFASKSAEPSKEFL